VPSKEAGGKSFANFFHSLKAAVENLMKKKVKHVFL
jgi:hypothetical protein